jgi:hypothetical protein
MEVHLTLLDLWQITSRVVLTGGYAKRPRPRTMVSKSQNPPGGNPHMSPIPANTFTNNSSPSHVTLHLTFADNRSKMASNKCRDAWLCKRTPAKPYKLDSHALTQPVDVLEHIHTSTRDPLRRRARNLASPLLAARTQVFQ